jgi:Tfp pilus assembly protein PilE
MEKSNKAFTIIETLIAFAIVTLVLGAAYKVLNDSIKYEEVAKDRLTLNLALSLALDKKIDNKSFFLSDYLRDQYKDIDDELRRSLKQRYDYTEKQYKHMRFGSEEAPISIEINRCKIVDDEQNQNTLYRVVIK